MKHIELRDGGLLPYMENFIGADLADQFFCTLRERCSWEQRHGIFGHMPPRLICSHGDPGVMYRYSGADYPALPW
jgi:hypothetical protein